MTYPTFNPSLQPETANITEKVRENTNEFGDGYAQSVKDGINADRAARDYKKEVISVPADRKVTIKMAPGGGFAARISRK